MKLTTYLVHTWDEVAAIEAAVREAPTEVLRAELARRTERQAAETRALFDEDLQVFNGSFPSTRDLFGGDR